MNKTRFISLLLGGALSSCALLAAWSQLARAEPDGNFKASDKTRSGAIVASSNLPSDWSRLAGEPIPFMTDALNYARTGNVAKGTKAAVYATVVITSASSQTKPGRSSVEYAHGLLSLEGAKGKEHFAGDLDLARNLGDEATPFHASSSQLYSKRISIYPNGHVAIRTKYRAKRADSTTSFTSDGSDGFLWGRDTSGGTPQLISVALSKSISPLSGASAPVTSAAPRGMRVRVSPAFIITNSNDGSGLLGKDNTIEIFGSLQLNNQQVWSRTRSNELSAKKGNVILGKSIEVEIYDNDPATWRMSVNGKVEESDKPLVAHDDLLWQKFETVDLKAALEQLNGVIILSGQYDDESADLKLTVEKIADIN